MLVSVLSGKNDPSKKKQIDPFGDSLPVTGGERLVSVCAWVRSFLTALQEEEKH